MLNNIAYFCIIAGILLMKCVLVSSHYGENFDCDPPWEKLYQTCVQFVKVKPFPTWPEARSSCISMNSDLLSINDREESTKIIPLLKRHVKSIDTLKWWIGLRHARSSWRWVDNDKGYAEFPQWGPNSGRIVNLDDNSSHVNRCVHLNFQGYLTDVECTAERKPYICEQFRITTDSTTSQSTTTTTTTTETSKTTATSYPVPTSQTGEELKCSGYRCDELFAKIEKLECRLEYTRELLEDKEKTRVEESKCSGYRCDELLAKIEKLECRLEYTRELLEDKEKTRVTLVPTTPCTQCPDTWIQYKGSCYLFVAAKNTFNQAKSHCLGLSADLVHIDNYLENEFIRSQLRTLKEKDYWIGLTDTDTEGTFKWVDDNSTASFTDWYTAQPDNGGGLENCVHFRDIYNYNWNDEICTRSYSWICEKKTNT